MKRTALLICAAGLLAGGPVHAQAIDSLLLRAHTRFLADDLLAGRGAGSTGERLAAAYIASQLERLGLEGLGPQGDYLLPIPLMSVDLLPGTTVSVERAGESTSFALMRDFIVNIGGRGAFRDFNGQLLFAGPAGIALRALQSSGGVRDRVVVIIGTLGGAAAPLMTALEQGGAAGLIVLLPDSAQYEGYRAARGEDRFFVAAEVEDPIWQADVPMIVAGPALTRSLVQGSGVPRALIEGAEGSSAVLIDRSVRFTLQMDTTRAVAANVGGVVRGSDPARRNEYIVYTAHYDHVGISTPDAQGDSIYNGFADNAAGVAMLLAIAEALRDAPPARSVAFFFLAAEEQGLLGASYLASQPPFPLDRIRGLINLDAGAPPAPPTSWRIPGGQGSALGALAAEVAREAGWTTQLTAGSPNSDYWPFLQRGVPAVFLIPGEQWEGTTPAEAAALRRRWDHYHRPPDEWSDEFPFRGLVRYADFALRLGLAAARQ